MSEVNSTDVTNEVSDEWDVFDFIRNHQIPVFLAVICIFLALFWLICHFMVKYCQQRTLAQHNRIYSDTAGGVERSQSFRHYQPKNRAGQQVEMQQLT